MKKINNEIVIDAKTLSGKTDLIIKVSDYGIVFIPCVGQGDEKDCDIEFSWGELYHLVVEGGV